MLTDLQLVATFSEQVTVVAAEINPYTSNVMVIR